jgi:hypothetical protein
MVGLTLNAVIPFSAFLLSWICFFALSYMILRAEFDKSDYAQLSDASVYLITTFRNSLGDNSIPGYDNWLQLY